MVRRFSNRRHVAVKFLAAIGSIPKNSNLVHLSHAARITVIRGQHLVVVDIPYAAGRDVAENILASQSRKGLAAVDVTAGDGIAAALHMAVLHNWISGNDHAVGGRRVNLNWDFIDLGKLADLIV